MFPQDMIHSSYVVWNEEKDTNWLWITMFYETIPHHLYTYQIG